MDEIKHEKISRKAALDVLLNIDQYLIKENSGTEGIKYNSDPDTALIEKTVLYHRICGDEKLRRGDTSRESLDKIKKMADDITGGKDPLAEHIKTRKTTENKVDLVVEVTMEDGNKAVFEQFLEVAMQKEKEAKELLEKLRLQEDEIKRRKEQLDNASQEEKAGLEEELKQHEEELRRKNEEFDRQQKELDKSEEEFSKQEELFYQHQRELEQKEAEQDQELNNQEVLQNGLDEGGRKKESKEKPEPKPETTENNVNPEVKKSEGTEGTQNNEEGQKKRENEKPEEVKPEVPRTTPEKLEAEAKLLEARLIERSFENPDCTPKEFMNRPENLNDLKRLIAIRLHRSHIEQQYRELEEALKYNTPEERERALRNRSYFQFEMAAAQDFDAHLQKLENTAEVATELQMMAGKKNMEHFNSELAWQTRNPHPLREHDNLARLENEMIPAAIKKFMNSPARPEEGSYLEDAFLDLKKLEENEFPENPTPEECQKRIDAYNTVIATLAFISTERGETKEGKELLSTLKDEVERLEDVTLAPEREKIEFNYKPDALIEYFDPAHPDQPMDAVEAREKLIRGVKLQQRTFNGDDFVGTTREVSYDKETGMIKKGPEKLVTRVVDLSEKDSLHPDQQLEDLKQIREVLKQADALYIRNPESYKKAMESLDKIIKTQEKLGPDADMRQLMELGRLYGDLDKNMTDYLKEKDDKLKAGGEKANIRRDALHTLQSITNAKHLKNMSEQLYPEQKEFNHQKRIADKYLEILNKWKDKTPQNAESRQEFMEDFKFVTVGMEELKNKDKDYNYTKMMMNLDGQLDNFVNLAEQMDLTEVEEAGKKIEMMKEFSAQGQKTINELAVKNPDPVNKTAPQKEEPKKEKKVEPPKKSNDGPSAH